MPKFETKKGDFAKIWQKLRGGGLQAPGSAAHALGSDKFLMSYYLFIFFIPSTCPAHDVTNFIDFD